LNPKDSQAAEELDVAPDFGWRWFWVAQRFSAAVTVILSAALAAEGRAQVRIGASL
jgi:hypothetical protein